jgi:hypothetical protein
MKHTHAIALILLRYRDLVFDYKLSIMGPQLIMIEDSLG